MKRNFEQIFPILLMLILFNLSCSSEEKEETDPAVVSEVEEAEGAVEANNDPMPDAVEEIAEEEESTGCKTNFSAYLYDPGEAYTNVRAAPSGDVVMELPWGEVEEEYMVTITESVDGWFKLEGDILGIETDFKIPGGIGWVHSSVVASDTRNYGGQAISLYEDPDETSAITGTIDQESGGLRPLAACGEWVLIELSYDDYYRKGWMKAEWLCGNPLTTCS